jgi:DNA polymerase III epsilon subunit-like protein
VRFVAVDFETSGTDHQRNAPVSLGVALFEDGEVLASREWLIGPPMHYKTGKITREYNIAALEISRSTWPQIRKAPAPAVVCEELAAWVREHDARELTCVAFNAPFDLGWYCELLFLGGAWDFASKGFRRFRSPLVGPWQCAMMLAADRVALSDYKLETVASHFGLGRAGEGHGALEDAILAGRVFWELVR